MICLHIDIVYKILLFDEVQYLHVNVFSYLVINVLFSPLWCNVSGQMSSEFHILIDQNQIPMIICFLKNKKGSALVIQLINLISERRIKRICLMF